jgi:tetratricopeptide (TPR) repeat protein/tRNA A-37 threonylcarbamoyl transferase component Bud32
MPEPASNHAAADRNLLFGILALQMDFITRAHLIEALNGWALQKHKPLGQILVEQGALPPAARDKLEPVVELHLAFHDHDPAKSLATVSALRSVCQDLQQVADPDVQASLDSVPGLGSTNSKATGPYAARPQPDLSAARRASGAGEGRYRVLRPYARGGLGEVFVAEDVELGREVALKEIRSEYARDRNSRDRFLVEAQITGALEHPGVVPVYGLGFYADGRPYYAMRLVRGETLQEAIQRFHAADVPGREVGERRLALRQLLSQFIAICNAVAYAHSRGVLHRDLKPANAILGKYGETILLDWGLAKAAGARDPQRGPGELPLQLLSGEAVATEAGTALGTPAYMSPEQSEGRLQELGPATDIYGLGATLYALLTGRPPVEGKGRGEVLRQAARGDWLPPRQIKSDVPAALDAVCRKAMAHDPRDRYLTALLLAADVEHWLGDEPVAAYRERLGARLGRWARRHPAHLAAAAAALLVSLLAGGGAWLWAAERRAETEQAVGLALGKAEQLLDQARNMKAEAPAGAAETLAVWKQALTAAEQADHLAAAGLVGEETAGRADRLLSEMQARARGAEQAFSQARKDTQLLAALEAARVARSVWKGQSFDYAAGATAYYRAFAAYGLDVRGQKLSRATELLRRMRPPVREAAVLALDDWATWEFRKDIQARLWLLATRADHDPWRRRLRGARDLQGLRKLATDARGQSLSAVNLDNLAIRLRENGDPAEAVTVWRDAQRRYPGDFWNNFDLGFALYEASKGSKEQLDEAISYDRAAVALRPANAPARNNLGLALQARGNLAGAILEFRRAVELDSHLALASHNLAIALQAKGDLPGAIQQYRLAVGLGPESAPFRASLGTALQANGDLAGAIRQYRRAIELDGRFAPAHDHLGTALQVKGDLPGAIQEYRRAIALDAKSASARSNLGLALQTIGDLAGAIQEYRRAIALDPQFIRAYYNLGNALKDSGDPAGAVQAYRRAIALDSQLAEAYCNMGFALQQVGGFQESLASFEKGHRIGMSRPGWRFPSAQWVKEAERLAELDRQLPRFIHGERKPQSARETLELALLCGFQQRFTAAARFYRDAFNADAQVVVPNRYNAACVAARAGTGQGKDAAGLDEPHRARWRRQARDWLRADLAAWAKHPNNSTPPVRTAIRQTLGHWQTDADLVGVRGKAELAKLPEAERREWAKLWADVAVLLAKAARP